VCAVGEIPQETAGPYPADGSQASSQVLNALALSGIVRRDIRTSLGTGNVAQGVPLTIELTLVSTLGDCAPLAGYAVYLWHCDREGRYSLYSQGVTSEDYLRGVQQADSNGLITFTSIFPACYSGRWPHVHFEIYPSLESATSASNTVHTTQLALPEDICDVVYATDGYSQSIRNMSQISLERDNVFSDGYELQMATVTGDATNGYVARLTVGIAEAATANPSASPSASPLASPSTPAANPAVPVTAIAGATYFTETGHNLGGSFRTYWQANGGLARFGFPLTEEFVEASFDDGKDYTVQYFERASFEAHPENQAPYNVLLSRLGLRLREIDPPADALADATYFPQTGHNLGGRFREYWLANGGLAVYGFPTSEEFEEVSPTDGKTYTVQYFERNRFEYHPENASPYDILLGLLGRQELVARGWLT
jgi:protocatechuate 3,4-dioxygenase beta subunit